MSPNRNSKNWRFSKPGIQTKLLESRERIKRLQMPTVGKSRERIKRLQMLYSLKMLEKQRKDKEIADAYSCWKTEEGKGDCRGLFSCWKSRGRRRRLQMLYSH